MKSAADRELTEAVRTIARGELYVSPHAGRVPARGIRRKDPHAALRARYEKLTDREQAVLRLVADGDTAPATGEQLFFSPKTEDAYEQRADEKLGPQHRNDRATVARRLGPLAPTS